MRVVPVWLAALLPQIPLLVWFVVAPSLVASDAHPLWHAHPFNMSTAVMRNDFGQAVRLMQQGEDPNQRYPVPGDSSADPERLITPLEAAVRSTELDMVKVLLDGGAIADGGERLRLSCLAVEREAEEIAEFLIGSVPSGAECASHEPSEPRSPR